MKKLLLLLLIVPMAFAAWQSIAGLAIITAALLLAIIFIIGMGFGVNELQLMAKEEFFQLIALSLMLVILVGSNSLIDALSTNPAFAVPPATNLQDSALKILSDTRTHVTSTMNDVMGYDLNISEEASKSSQCSVTGGGNSLGYGVSGCGGYTMLGTPLSMAGSILGFCIGELSAMERLIQISEASISFLLPLGILLRTFKLSRGAGGLLISLAISLHIMVPAGVLFNDMLSATFIADPSSAPYRTAPSAISIPSCDPLNVGSPLALGGTDNAGNAVNTYNALRASIQNYIYQIMIEATLGPILALLLMGATLRALTSLMGAEVDVSGITRFV